MFGEANSLKVEILLFIPIDIHPIPFFPELHRIESIRILSIATSDHAPLALTWDIGHRPTTKHWRLNASLVNDKEFTKFVTELSNYLDARRRISEVALSLLQVRKKKEKGSKTN